MKPFRNLVFISLFFSLTSCVSVKIAGTDSTLSKFDQAHFTEPQIPFQKKSIPSGDFSWVSRNTGNIISYLSECSKIKDIDLKSLEADAVSSLENPIVEQSIVQDFNNRKAIFSKIIGEIDGVKLFLELVIFKKNNCSFTLSYTGKVGKQSEESSHFTSFYKSFQVP